MKVQDRLQISNKADILEEVQRTQGLRYTSESVLSYILYLTILLCEISFLGRAAALCVQGIAMRVIMYVP